MPANLRWYPNELPALTQSTSSSSALETAVRSLQNDARTQSIRQALSRRSAGIIAAAEQNRGAIVIGSLMPLVIDPVVRSQPATQTASAVGTVGYITGSSSESTARSVDRVTFATDAVAALGDRVGLPRRGRGSASRLISGLLAGGTNVADGLMGNAQIEEFTYSSETAAQLPGVLPFTRSPIFGGDQGTRSPAGFSSTVHGFFVESYVAAGSLIARVNFDSKSIVLLSTSYQPTLHGAAFSTPAVSVFFPADYPGVPLGVSTFQFSTEVVSYNATPQETNGSSRQALGNGVNVWVFGGRRQNPTWNYRYTVSTGLFTKTAGDLSSAVVNAARVGSSAVGYLCGGTAGPYHYFNSKYTTAGLQTITKFAFTTEAVTAAPNALSTPRSHGVGISNFAGAFA